jgi:hypothetical protein
VKCTWNRAALIANVEATFDDNDEQKSALCTSQRYRQNIKPPVAKLSELIARQEH